MPTDLPSRCCSAIVLLAALLLAAGCSTPVVPDMSGTLVVTSVPEGAGMYLDNEYHGTTPATIRSVSPGTHQVELRSDGYERWSAPVTVPEDGTITVPAYLVAVGTAVPVTYATTTPVPRNDLPRIHVDGYWTWPEVRSSTNPVPLLLHIDSYNVGDASAREVTVAAHLYYEGRMICWNTIYLGTLRAGSHVTKDTMVSCMLPSGMNDPDLVLKFENIEITP